MSIHVSPTSPLGLVPAPTPLVCPPEKSCIIHSDDLPVFAHVCMKVIRLCWSTFCNTGVISASDVLKSYGKLCCAQGICQKPTRRQLHSGQVRGAFPNNPTADIRLVRSSEHGNSFSKKRKLVLAATTTLSRYSHLAVSMGFPKWHGRRQTGGCTRLCRTLRSSGVRNAWYGQRPKFKDWRRCCLA